MADDLGGIRRASCLGVLNMPCQRVDNIAGEVGAIGRRQRGALLALEIIAQDELLVVLGKNQVDAGSLEISVKEQLCVRDDNRVRRSVRRRNGLDVDVPVGMRTQAISGQLGVSGQRGVEFAGVIQRAPQ